MRCATEESAASVNAVSAGVDGAVGSVMAATPSFEQRLEQFYLQLSEGNTGGMVACVDEMERIVAGMVQDKSASPEETTQASAAVVYEEMLLDCRRKAGEATLDRLRKLCQILGRIDVADEGYDPPSGDGMAEEESVMVSYHAALLGRAESAANIYGGFLRNRLKQANDAAVKKLSSVRALYRLNLASGGGLANVAAGQSTDAGKIVGGGATHVADPHPHITALATVLGEGSKLMVRLTESSLGQGLEETVSDLLHGDTKQQAVKILEWFQNDADLPKWQAHMSAKGNAGRASPGSKPPSAPSSGNGRNTVAQVWGNRRGRSPEAPGPALADDEGSAFDARSVDFVIDEMALACQYCQRYLDFVADDLGLSEEPSSEFFVQVRVIEGVYVQLEDAYCLKSVQEAMRIAEPIEVQNGTYVSSMVEDASFLVHKSLRRSVSTRSEQAIMAVCNRVTEILDPHAPEPSFYSGLATEADHRVPHEAGGDDNGGGIADEADDFSTALAKALDEAADAELGDGNSALRWDGGEGTGSNFGGVEGAMVGINSVHVALSSVSAIQDALNRFLEASNPLVRLMLDEVARILHAYKKLRNTRLHDVLEALYPSVSKALASAFWSSSYALGPAEYELRSAELPGARRVLDAATLSLTGDEAGSAEGEVRAETGKGGGDRGAANCRTGLLQEPFEELVRSLAGKIAASVEAAARSKGPKGKGRGGDQSGADATAATSRGASSGSGFTEWGALLLRKEVRTLQQGLAALLETDSLNAEFSDLNEVVRLLNFERPSDALEYRPPSAPARPEGKGPREEGRQGCDSAGTRPIEGVKDVLRLRIDFQRAAIDALEL